MITIREKRSNVSKMIEANDLDRLKHYILENDVDLKLMNNKNFDTLIHAIECNASTSLISFIINNCNYKTLNYYYYKRSIGNVSPLLFSILKNNFNVSNFLLSNNANINFQIGNEDMFSCLYKQEQLTVKNLNYLLDHNIDAPSSYFINNLINNSQNLLLKIIFKHYAFDFSFIQNLLNCYKNRIPLTPVQLKKIIKRFEFDESMYDTSINKDNFEALDLLFRYDIKDEYESTNKLFKILDRNDNKRKKDYFIEEVNNKRIKVPIDDHFIDNLCTIETKREIIMNMIKEDKVQELNNFIKENRFSLSYFNNQNMDILMYAIDNKASLEMMKLIFRYNPYKTLNYTIELSKTPLLSVFSQNRLDIAELLIQNGADVNYTVSFERIIYYLYFLGLNPKLLKLLLNYGVVLTYDTFDVILKLIESSQNSLLRIIFNHFIYNTNFILSFLNLYNNKIPLSKKQLRNTLWKEKSKLKIKKNWYDAAINNKNYEALKILTDHDSRKNFKALKILSNNKI